MANIVLHFSIIKRETIKHTTERQTEKSLNSEEKLAESTIIYIYIYISTEQL